MAQILQSKTLGSANELTDEIQKIAERELKAQEIQEKVRAKEEEALDEFSNSKIKLIPTPTFQDEISSIGTSLPINLADDTVSTLAVLSTRQGFIDFIQEKLNYSSKLKIANSFKSEQIDALVMAISSFERGNAFILGDMAGIGKGRVCAGIMRYAYQRGLIPMFITHKPYLFSDINRDIKDIGGFGTDEFGNMIKPNPLVMHPDGAVEEENPENPSEKIQVFSPIPDRQLLQLLEDKTDEIDRSREISLPEDYNAVFLPYSTIAQSRKLTKQNFLEAIAPKCIIIFDESHNAASSKSDSVILKRTIPLVNKAEGVLFSSATYAKSPAVFSLYVIRTALKTAISSMDYIKEALKVGGENVAEYIATGLVKEGQMIRRERSFGDCKKVTEYVGTKLVESAGKMEHIQLPDAEDQKVFYNEAIAFFKELRDFSKSRGSKDAVKVAIGRKCLEEDLELANVTTFKDVSKRLKNPRLTEAEKNELKNAYISGNRGKWILSYNPDNITRYKQTFRENLFLGIKAKFATDKIIECLKTEVTYRNSDGEVKKAPQKPVVAIRNTGEAIFNELRLESGSQIKNDFSEYLKAIFQRLFTGEFTLRKVDNNIFETYADLARRNIRPNIKHLDYNVQREDYDDTLVGDIMTTRANLEDIERRLNAYSSQIPFSFIDYLRAKLENTDRPSYYYVNGDGVTPRYGEAVSPKFKLVEGTGRRNMLVPMDPNDPNSVCTYLRNDRPENITDVFKSFNNGSADVMLINVVASTGGSAQSSPKEGKDTRPRNMFTIQFELDINTEVQKRGRINRTGQINSPTYTYVISQIPVELRTYLMFRKKLRKLDANTSADQTASVENAEITDSKGLKVEDIFNEYGFDVFKENFIELPQFIKYKEIFDGLIVRPNSDLEGDAELVEYNISQFDAFVRELELYPTESVIEQGNIVVAGQSTFFDEMNTRYKDYIQNLKNKGEYQLELEARDYKAVLRQSILVQLNSGTSVFSLPLFLSDYYTIDDKKMWSRDKVQQKISELSAQTINGQKYTNPTQFHIALIQDYKAKIDLENAQEFAIFRRDMEPKRENFETEEEFEAAQVRFQGKLATLSNGRKNTKDEMSKLFSFYKPGKAVRYDGNTGVFLGYKLKDEILTGSESESELFSSSASSVVRFRYSPGNIEFLFCFLSSIPYLKIRKTTEGSETLNNIITETRTFENFVRGLSPSSPLYSKYSDIDKAVAEWKPDLTRRRIRRFYTGNILGGIVEANRKRKLDQSPNWQLTRFQNLDGSFSTAVELKYSADALDREKLQLDNVQEELRVSVGNERFINFIEELPISREENDLYGTICIWSAPNDRVLVDKRDWKRAVGVIKTQIQTKSAYYPIVHFNICQPYSEKDGVFKDPLTPLASRWNYIYNDQELEEKYESNMTNLGRVDIKYARYIEQSYKGDKLVTKLIKEEYKVKLKRYSFNLAIESDVEQLRSFNNDLADKYDLFFNFRSEMGSYANTPIFDDPLAGGIDVKELKQEKQFEEGEYTYRFIKNPSEQIISQIPKLKEITSGGLYGYAVVTFPLTPIQCKSFELIPKNVPTEVMVKMSLYVLNDIEKANFTKDLETKAPEKTDFEIGLFVSSFLTARTVGTTYFFGDLTVAEYGAIFREFALKKDISKLITKKTQFVKVEEKLKDKVTFEDAERFLMILNP